MAKKTGTIGNDVINGTAGADTLVGLSGNDKLFGLAGDDTLIGDSGNDKLYGGLGNDFLFGASGADLLDGGDGSDWALYLTSGGTSGVSVSLLKHKGLSGDARGDKYVSIENVQGTNFADVLVGDAGNNVLDGGGGNDKLSGGDGNDVLVGGAGADRLDGGAGVDVVSYDSRTAKKAVHADLLKHVFTGGDAQGDKLSNIENITGTKFADFLQGDADSNELNGGAGNDTIYGGGGNDVLIGGAGNDFLSDVGSAPGGVVIFVPGAGADKIVGNGNDLLDYFDATSGVSIDLLQSTSGGGALGDTFSGILSVYGSQFGDVLVSSTAGHANMRGLGGDDVITLNGASDTALGGSGNDSITLKGANAVAQGGAGDDTLLLRGLNEQAFGDAGNDTIDAAVATNAALYGGAGDDKLFGGAGSDVMVGGDGNDILRDADTTPGSDVDVFAPGAGIDTVIGDGNDTIDYSDATSGVSLNLGTHFAGGAAAGDTYTGILNANGSNFDDIITSVTLGAGHGLIQGFGGNDRITLAGVGDEGRGGAGNDTIVLLGGSQTARGDEGDDVLDASGAVGAATLDGGAGNDTLTGGTGSDTLIGRAGNDILKDGSVTSLADVDIFAPGDGIDTVTGDGNDTIDYFDATSFVTLNLATNAAGGAAAGDTYTGILNANGSDFNDNLVSSAVAASATISGRKGDDSITLNGASDQAFGGDGNDTITLSGASQTARGDAGDDHITVAGTADNAFGGAGNDTILLTNSSGTATYGTISGEAGNDIIDASAVTVGVTLNGGADNDTLTGGSASDVLIGGNGNDILKDGSPTSLADHDTFMPGLGIDTVTGDGNDTLEFSDIAVGVTVNVAAGTATGVGVAITFLGILSVTGTSAGDTIVSSLAGPGPAIIQGLGGADTLTIQGASDQAFGGDGVDTIHLQGGGQLADGGNGNDILEASGVAIGAASGVTLHGGAGNDKLTGSTHNDFFALENPAGFDTITNFTAGDKLLVDLMNSGLTGIGPGVGNAINVNNFVSAAGHMATLGNAQLLYDESMHDLYYDFDGTGAAAAVQLAHLANNPVSLATTDFFIL